MKTVIIDCGGMIHSNFFISTIQKNMSVTEQYSYWKYLNLNFIRKTRLKFKPDELILACDSPSWRKLAWKYYKAARVKKKGDSGLDWEMFYSESNKFLDEIRTIFKNIKVLKIKGAEADDIIAVITNGLRNIRDEIVIVSRDKDFKQLMGKNVFLYDLSKQKYIECKSPKKYLLKQILAGDSSDGIPNIRSDNDVFINSEKRQKPFGPKTITKVLISGLDEYIKMHQLEDNFERNKLLISLSPNIIPKDIQKNIFIAYKKTKTGKNNYMEVQKYFAKNKFRSLIEKIEHFM
jgi:5'-3' exonuclease